MNFSARMLHGLYRNSVKLYQRLFIETYVWGHGSIPPGPKIYTINHISSHDGLRIAPFIAEPVHYIIGPGYQTRLGSRLLNAMESINAFTPNPGEVVEQAVAYLKKGEPIAIAPEGNIQESFSLGRFMPGVARIYLASGVPIIPIAILVPKRCLRERPKKSEVINGHLFRMVNVIRGPFCINFGEPWSPEYAGLSEAKKIVLITRELRDRIASLVEDMRVNKFWM